MAERNKQIEVIFNNDVRENDLKTSMKWVNSKKEHKDSSCMKQKYFIFIFYKQRNNINFDGQINRFEVGIQIACLEIQTFKFYL